MENELWRWVWVAAAMLMGLGEIFTAGFFLLPFGIGAALAAAAAWLDLHGAVQWLLFFGGTAVSMLVLRRFMGNQDRPDDLPVGANRYIGMHARAVEVIDTVNNTGRVRVESDEWRAVCDTERIDEGSLVRVVALAGTKLRVEFVEPPPDDYQRRDATAADPPAAAPQVPGPRAHDQDGESTASSSETGAGRSAAGSDQTGETTPPRSQ
ncbi:NfeD family protein [Candidatus Poriferisodalis sp.]|uniref:NfeD family protein n=1 Tax=Candidatus Poriferisodalis sp. TaxID=3101277 RepID=UPI003B0182EF